MPFVKALLQRGVPCTHDVVMKALYGEHFAVGVYLMETYPELISTKVLRQVGYRGEYEYVFKLQTSHPHLWDMSIANEFLCGENPPATWESLRSLYERCASMPLKDDTLKSVWHGDYEAVLVFMWLVWQDPRISASLAAADRTHRLRLYARLRESVPSLFADVPTALPWCCQLDFLREKVETGRLSLAEVEQARSERCLLPGARQS